MNFQLYTLEKRGVLKYAQLREGDMVEIQSHESGGSRVITVAFLHIGDDRRPHRLVTSNKDDKVLMETGVTERMAINGLRAQLAQNGLALHFLYQDQRCKTMIYMIKNHSAGAG